MIFLVFFTQDLIGNCLKEKVAAVVFDSPSILHYERHEGSGKVKVIGPLFDIQPRLCSRIRSEAQKTIAKRAVGAIL